MNKPRIYKVLETKIKIELSDCLNDGIKEDNPVPIFIS